MLRPRNLVGVVEAVGVDDLVGVLDLVDAVGVVDLVNVVDLVDVVMQLFFPPTLLLWKSGKKWSE